MSLETARARRAPKRFLLPNPGRSWVNRPLLPLLSAVLAGFLLVSATVSLCLLGRDYHDLALGFVALVVAASPLAGSLMLVLVAVCLDSGKRRRPVASWCIGGGSLSLFLLSTPIGGIILLAEDGPAPLAGAILVSLVAAATGAFLGAVVTPPLHRLQAHRLTHELRDRTVRVCALWIAALSPVSAIGMACNRGLLAVGQGVMLLPPIAVGLVALALALRADLRIRSRRAWLARVRRGEVPGWAVVEADEAARSLDLVPLVQGREGRDALLVQTGAGVARGPYRGGLDRRAVALA